MSQNPIQLIQRVVINYKLAFAFGGMLNQDFGPEFFGEALL